MKIDREFFEKAIYTATFKTSEVFEGISSLIERTQTEFISGIIPSTMDTDTLPDDVQEIIKRYICFKAYCDAIPMLDLVMTSTGFGVVSNQNVAPASKDRVEALRKSMEQLSDSSFDEVINSLINNVPLWRSSAPALRLVNSLFFTAHQLKDYAGQPYAYRSDLRSARPAISESEMLIEKRISTDLMKHLVDKTRTNDPSDKEIEVIHMIRSAIGAFISKNVRAFRTKSDDVVNFLENNISDFPAYQNSQAYRVKHMERYQNAQDDTCYFF